MRYAFVSDLHANWQAWQTVLADITAMRIDKIICLGDVVGYGPRPAEVLASVYANVDHFVLGNHDAVIGGCLPTDCFNADARRLIDWTRNRLDDKAVRFFRDIPLAVSGDRFRAVHGSPERPAEFGYVFDEEDARRAWSCCSEEVLFVGHTHAPRLHYLNRENKYRNVEPVDFLIEPGKRYLVNVGSVGMPRDKDFRAGYVIYDDEEASVSFRRLAYDIESFRADVLERVSDAHQAKDVLRIFDEQARGPIREHLDFSPGATRLRLPVVEEQRIEALQASASRWRIGALALLLLCLAVAGAAWIQLRQRPRLHEQAGGPGGELSLAGRASGTAISLLPNAVYRASMPPPGWIYRRHDADTQSITITPVDGLVIDGGDGSRDIEVILPLIRLAGRRKLQVLVTGPPGQEVAGEMPILYFDEIYSDGRRKNNVASKTGVVLRDGSIRIQRTTRMLPKSLKAIQLRIRCRFRGRLRFDRCVIIPKQ